MASSGKNTDNLIKRITGYLSDGFRKDVLSSSRFDETAFTRREKVVVFALAYIIALGLWLMVNLDRDFLLTVDLPLTTGVISEGQALANPIPDKVNVSISGEGWKLLNLYNIRPRIPVTLDDGTVNLFEQVQDILASYPDLTVTKVHPAVLNVQLEERITRKVPVQLNLDLSFRTQYGFVGPVRMFPDSVIVSGARSRVAGLASWPTEAVKKDGVRESIDLTILLETPPEVVELSVPEIRVVAQVSEYTEGEIRIPVRTRGLPPGREITFVPSAVTVRYDVPIEEYVESQDIIPYTAFVSYSKILNDTTGFVTPTVEVTTDRIHLRLRSVQPRTVSYYQVVTSP